MDWFVVQDEKVSGPHTTEALKELWSGGYLADTAMVWGRGDSEWRPVQIWMKAANTVTPIQSAHESRTPSQQWHFAKNGESKGPFTRPELLHELRHVRDKDQILLWTKGMKAWADLYEFQDILTDLGLNRREDPRANLDGIVKMKIPGNKDAEGILKTISVGGFGVNGLSAHLTVGQTVEVELSSPAFDQPISVKAQAQYVTESGFAGFKFLYLGSEAKGLVVQYLRSVRSAETATKSQMSTAA
jgi:hypothetical protein